MFEMQGQFIKHSPPYLPGELLQVPSFYPPPMAFYFDSYNDDPSARLVYWFGMFPNVIQMTVGSRIRMTGLDAARKLLEEFVWTMQADGHLLATREPRPTQPTPQPPVFQ